MKFLDRSKIPLCWLLFLALSEPLVAQESGIRGRVEDAVGNPIHEAEVQLLDADTGQILDRIYSDHNGLFKFSDQILQRLEIVALKPGFQPTTFLIAPDWLDQEIILILVTGLPETATEMSVFGVIPRTAASASVLRDEEFTRRVVDDTADVLRIVPGLTVVQHAGGGKANQFLIRGFDADHGTDFAVSFAGIPVNLVSHAHGQGYADLNFLIPETLASIDVYKGPYFAELGNLATAGAAILRLREEFDASFVQIEGGQFETGRVLAGWSPKVSWGKGFVALEGRYTNGPLVHPQAFRKANFATHWSFDPSPSQTISLLGTTYRGEWDQSGQVPLREVQAGRLDRFGAIDPSEGGDSSRQNLSLSYQKVWSHQALNSQFYFSHYELDLFSNFTFLLNDPERGDGLLQSDNREIIGGHLQYHRHHDLGGLPSLFTAGLDYRQDFAEVGLFRQQERQVFDTLVDAEINERNVGIYLQQELELHPTLKVILGLRHDRFRFDVEDSAGRGLDGIQYRHITGPKVSLVYAPVPGAGPEFYLNYGQGFHSNDARSVVADPAGVALAAADGYELGYRHLLGGKIEVGLAYWLLDLDGELIWVGEEGTTELAGPTRRHGPEIEVRWKLSDHLWLDGEASYTWSGARGTSDVVARAPRLVTSGGLAFTTPGGLTGNLRLRHVGSHPLVEDNSVQAEPFTVTDLFLHYPFSDHWSAQLSIENLFDADIKEAQSFFVSRLPSEMDGVRDNHFTPGNPFTLRAGFRYTF